MNSFSPRWRKVMRDLWSNKTRTFLVVMSIAIGVFAAGAMAGGREINFKDLNTQYQLTNDRSAIVSAQRVDEQFINAVRRMTDINDAEGRAVYLLPALIERENSDELERRNLLVNVIGDFSNMHINQFAHLRGEKAPPQRELLIERASAQLFGKDVGDTITVELTDGTKRTMRIAGVVHDVNAVPVNFANFATAYVTLDTIAWLGFPRSFNQLRYIVEENRDNYGHVFAVGELIKKRVQDQGMPFGGIQIDGMSGPGKHFGTEPLSAISLVLLVMGIMSLALSAFLVVNTINAIMTQHLRQIGIMKAIGARADQIAVMYLCMALIYGALALFIAVPLGILGAQGLARFIANLLNYDIISILPAPWVLAMQVAVGLLLPLVAALIPVINVTRIPTRIAMYSNNGSDEHAGKNGAQNNHSTLIAMLNRTFAKLNRPMTLAVRNTFRRKARLALTLLTLTLASAMFVAVFSVRASLENALSDTLDFLRYDIQMNVNGRPNDARLLREISDVIGVERAEAWNFVGAVRILEDGKENNRSIGLNALPTDSTLLMPQLIEGRWLHNDDTDALVVNTYVTHDDAAFKVGETVTLKIGAQSRNWRVVGIIRGAVQGSGNRSVGYITQEGLRQALSFGRQSNRLMVVTQQHDGATQTRIARDIEEKFKRAKIPISNYQTITERADEVRFQFNLLISLLLIMAAMVALVGTLSLTGTLSINVIERTREIGVMRAIGASNNAIRRVIIVEGLVIGLISWALGAMIALPMGRLLSDNVGATIMRIPPRFIFAWDGLWLWLGVALVVAVAASLGPAWRASRLTVREILAYE